MTSLRGCCILCLITKRTIVHALSKLPDLEKAQLRVTFDLANFIARVVSDQMLRMADHILDWLDILSYQFSRLIFNSVIVYSSVYVMHEEFDIYIYMLSAKYGFALRKPWISTLCGQSMDCAYTYVSIIFVVLIRARAWLA